MSDSLDLEKGWLVLTPQAIDAEPFRDSPACRAVFARLPEILGDLRDEIATRENLAHARLRIALDTQAIDALRDAGFRFAESPAEDVPFLLIVNGDESQRDAILLHTEHKLPIAALLPVWPQSLVWFAKR